MYFEQVKYHDLYQIGRLQPEGWPDIVPAFKLYIDSENCLPIKVTIDGQIVGLGACTIFDDTAWLSHIIVSSQNRNKGIGFQIVDKLLKYLYHNSLNTIFLIATELGLPVYLKSGFRVVSDYLFYRKEVPWNNCSISANIIDYQNGFLRMVLELDHNISGENRSFLIKEYLPHAKVFLHEEKITGLYIPGLCEGPIVAANDEAGLELMKFKYSTIDKAVVPAENASGIDFLQQNGFVTAEKKGIRMVIGADIPWQPNRIYSRISGNFG